MVDTGLRPFTTDEHMAWLAFMNQALNFAQVWCKMYGELFCESQMGEPGTLADEMLIETGPDPNALWQGALSTRK